jgi:ComEC/Rec2-related protein
MFTEPLQPAKGRVGAFSLPRLPLLGVALAAVTGILVAEYFHPSSLILGIATVAVLVLSFFRSSNVATLLAAAGCFALVHTWQWTDNPDRAWAAAIASEPRHVTVEGVLVDEPETSAPDLWRARLRVDRWNLGSGPIVRPAEIVVRWRSAEPAHYGDRWRIEGQLAPFAAARNPGQFDTAQWYARQGIFLELRTRDASQAQFLARDEGSPVKAAAIAAREWIMRTLGIGLESHPEIHAVIAGITLGAREEAAEDFTPAFRQTGTLHLFAVSGLHVGMFALLLWLTLRPLGLNRRQAILVIIPLLFFYSLVTGAKPSSLRAATMISIALGGFLLDRAPAPGNSLAAAALVLLGFDTNQLFQPGFQLSFAVVASIILLAPLLDQRLAARWRPDPFLPRKLYSFFQRGQARAGRLAAASLAVSASSWLGSLPLTVSFFHLVPVLAIPVNMIAVPLAFVVLSLAVLALIGGAFTPFLAAVFNHLNSVVTAALLALVQSAAALPGAWFHLPPGFLQPPARLTVFDLSTGGAQLLRTREATWLFDTGSDYDARSIIEPALRAAGVGQLDAVVLTHGDTEHIAGAPRLLQEQSPRRWITSILRDRARSRAALHGLLQDRGLSKSLVLPGDQFRAGDDTTVTILRPGSSDRARTADDQSIVARIDHGAFRVLLMSDSGAAAEDALVRGHASQLRADILVLGRHKEDLFATDEFLAEVQPRAVILAPRDPFRDGSDEPALRARLAASGATLFDQDESGAVTVTFDRGRASVRAYVGNRSVDLSPR